MKPCRTIPGTLYWGHYVSRQQIESQVEQSETLELFPDIDVKVYFRAISFIHQLTGVTEVKLKCTPQVHLATRPLQLITKSP